MANQEWFSAKAPQEYFGGRPTSAPVVRVRDVLMCVGPETSVPIEEFVAHPPIAGAYEMREKHSSGLVELGRGARIDRLSQADASLLVTACSPRGHYFMPLRHDAQRYSLVRDVDPEVAERHPYAWDSDQVLWHALTLSRLVRDNNYSTEFAARITDFQDGEQTVVYALTGESKHVYRLRDDREWLDADEGHELASLLSKYWAWTPSSDSRLGRALWRAEWASWLMFGDSALAILVSGLEALLKTREDAGATQQFKHRVPLLADEVGIRDVDEDVCRELYRTRSEWIHGSHVRLFSSGTEKAQHDRSGVQEGPRNDRERHFLALAAVAQDVLRAAVRRCIEAPEFRSVFDEARTIRARWPVPRETR